VMNSALVARAKTSETRSRTVGSIESWSTWVRPARHRALWVQRYHPERLHANAVLPYAGLIRELLGRTPADEVSSRVRRMMRLRSITRLCLFGAERSLR
jgi:hypothetical protein